MGAWNRVVTAGAAVAVLSGCFTYTEVDRASLAPGATVRVVLERQEAVRQMDALGGLHETLEGRVQPQSNDTQLALTVRRNTTPAEGGRFNNYVALPWASLGRLEVKRFSPMRTAAVAAGAGVVAALTLSVLEGSSTPGGNEQPPVNDAVRIPLLRFHW